MDPEEVVARDADASAMGPFGSEPGFAHRVAAIVSDLIAEIGGRLVQGRRPRVLEVTGEAAEAVCLVALVDTVPCDLVVAAPDQQRRAELAGQLRHKPAIRTCVIDPADPSASVAALGGRFDLVVLGSGLAADDPAKLLGQVRPLIAQDGALMVVEQHPARVHDLCFGLHPGWWSMGGHHSPLPRLRTPEAWQGLLARHGFSDTVVVPDTPHATGAHYLLFARSDGDVQPAAATAAVGHDPEGPWCLLVDATPYAAALARQLSDILGARGQRVLRIAQGNAATGLGETVASVVLDDGADWPRLLDDLRAAWGEPLAIVNLVGLDPGYATGDAARCLERQERRAAALLASLQGCGAARARPSYYVVTAHAGVGLLPAAMRQALGSARCVGDAPIWALARVAMNEFPDLRVRWVDLAETLSPQQGARLVADELLDPDGEDEVILLSSGRFAPRARVLGPEIRRGYRDLGSRQRIYLDVAVPGPLKNLVWHSDDLPAVADGEVEIAVRAAGLNFRDVMYAMGLLPDEALESGFSGQTLGMELSGVVTAVGGGVTEPSVGDAVIAFAPAAFASRVITRATAVVPKPEGWSFAAAATIPTAFFTAYYAIRDLAQLAEGERILIHGAAGGVGIAAIQIAKHLGAEIFATAGTSEKRDFVGMLGADHVLDSRSLAFADRILEITAGAGVDVVLNSLAGEGINRSLRVLRPFGRFLELGKRDFFENTRIGLRPFRNNIAYFGIDADQLMVERPALARRVFLDLMSLFGRKLLKPLPYRAFDASEVVDAFRYMQHSRQIGKVVVTFPQGFAPVSALTRECPALRLRKDATYLVTGGLSGFGLHTAQWLAAKGARSLVLLSRRGEGGEGVPQATLAALRGAGVQVWAPACDVTDRVALADVLATLGAALPPLRGIVHAAMVIDDALLCNLTGPQLHRVLAAKVLGAMHLDALTEGVPLDFFVLYSSATTLFGNPGQGNYVAANMTLEGLAVDRRARGEPATCVGWGPIEDVGYLARNPEVKQALVSRMGGKALRADEALAILEEMLVCGTSNLAVLDLAWGAIERFLPAAAAPKFSELAALGQDATPGVDGGDDLRRQLDGLGVDELHGAVIDILKQELGEILRLAPDELDIGRSVYDMGMDSLMGAELITALDARLGIALPLMALSEGPTIARLSERIVHLLRPSSSIQGEMWEPMEPMRQLQEVAKQHGEELDPGLVEALSESLSSGTAKAGLPVTRGNG
jgi:NADPH:quinone reductase-like Zn-dependent oxidoreductase/acyl carrier protein